MASAPYDSPAPPKSNGKAVIAMVLAFLSLGCPFVLSIPALILGFMAVSQAKSRGAGKGMAIFSIILAFVTLIIEPVVLLFGGLVVVAVKAKDRTIAINNMKQMGLALNTYAGDSGGTLPLASGDTFSGKPSKLSWRVAMLPYVEEHILYQQFHHDEPWDSPHNLTLLPKMPRVYLNPKFQSEADRAKGLTYFQVFTGPGTPMGGPDPVSLGFISSMNGTARTILVAEAGEAVPWTKPEDIPYDPQKPLPKLGGPGGGSFLVVGCDGAVHTIRAGTSEASIRSWIQYTNSGTGPILGD